MEEDVSELARLLGQRGGNKTKLRGSEYYREIGRKGGNKTKLRGAAFFSHVGRLSHDGPGPRPTGVGNEPIRAPEGELSPPAKGKKRASSSQGPKPKSHRRK